MQKIRLDLIKTAFPSLSTGRKYGNILPAQMMRIAVPLTEKWS